MVEKVREAVCRVDPYCSDAEAIARAAIEALMEPDETMISAYFEKCAQLGFTAHITATAAWKAMLSKALED